MSSGVVAIDAQGEVVALNPGAQRILGCPSGDACAAFGRHCREALSNQPAVAQLLLDTLDGREALSRAEIALETESDHLENTIGFTLTPVRDDSSGVVCGAAIIFRDLTPLERMGEQERLHERLAALGQMAAGLAHEIRNPLASMEMMAGLLKRRLVDHPDERSLVVDLQGELRSLAQTVTDCLEFVKPISPERGSVDAEKLLEESLSTARARCCFEGVIDRAYDEELPELNVDIEQLQAVLTNLIVNALESMVGENGGRQKRLGLSLAQLVKKAAKNEVACREVVIRVSDTGPGVPRELREKIFYPFFTTKQSGSGVGLANAQKILASHGGSIGLEPGTESGCSFAVHLPVEDEKP
jgi:nitrogen-specific signal transduction histidine kinase